MISAPARRRILSAATRPDPYLTAIAAQHATHGFLRGATQGCYQRQVALIAAFHRAQGREPRDVRVLDWGTGKGHVSYLLKAAGFEVTSCDVRSAADDSAFSQETPILAQQGVEVVPLEHPWQLPFASGRFDAVVSFGVLEHVPHERESLGEIVRVLKPGGALFFFFLPYWLSWTQRLAHACGDRYHDRLYRIGALRRQLAEAGLDLRDVWHGQLLPKNPLPASNLLERFDRLLTDWSPLRYLATNLEGVAIRR